MELSHYDRLVRYGTIGSLKRDVLLEASEDVWFLDHICKYFSEESGGAEADVIPCTVRLVRELVAANLTYLATWGLEGSYVTILKTDTELVALIESLTAHPLEFFLVATESGKEWVARYKRLVGELSGQDIRHA
jgi:hypothetical protein